jgi:hypothetical protein
MWKERTWLDTWEIVFNDPDDPEWVLTRLRDWWSMRHDCGVEEFVTDRHQSIDSDYAWCVHCGAKCPKALDGLSRMMTWSERDG